ncbi:MAG TPA: hypothetical protein VFW40_14175, partial [Capsulimonadaceae bacterium]|nr:hypothetical protein [Capsulimonadaceae bacterium]
APALGQAVDGVLGADFLATAEPLIDFGRHEIRFLAPGPLQDADLKALGLTEAVDLPITETRSLPAQITSGRITVEEPLAISTGSSVTTLPDSVEKALNSHSHSPLSISNFSLCGLDLGPETVSYAADSQVGAGVGVGVDLLSSFLVLVDYQNNRVYLALTKDSNASQQTADTGARP